MSNNTPEALRLARMTDKQRLPEVGGKPDAATEALRHKMMGGDKQPNALALADALETFHNPHDKQAAELRRLHNEVRVLTECYRLDGARDIALLRQALEALKKSHPYSNSDRDLDKHSEAIHALRAALAEPCEMGAMCLNCQPRGPNGECPDAPQPKVKVRRSGLAS